MALPFHRKLAAFFFELALFVLKLAFLFFKRTSLYSSTPLKNLQLLPFGYPFFHGRARF